MISGNPGENINPGSLARRGARMKGQKQRYCIQDYKGSNHSGGLTRCHDEAVGSKARKYASSAESVADF